MGIKSKVIVPDEVGLGPTIPRILHYNKRFGRVATMAPLYSGIISLRGCEGPKVGLHAFEKRKKNSPYFAPFEHNFGAKSTYPFKIFVRLIIISFVFFNLF
jgi:hypothetical protein